MYNLDIPGWMPEYDLKILENLAYQMPDGAQILEVGSFAGRSAWCLAKSAKNSTVHCVDRWDTSVGISEKGLMSIDPHPQGFVPYSWQEFKKNTSDCDNIISHQGFSPTDFLKWDIELDMIFIDDDHKTVEFVDNLEHWFKYLKPGGILAGHDFRLGRYTHIVEAVLDFSSRHQLPITVHGYSFVWYGVKKND